MSEQQYRIERFGTLQVYQPVKEQPVAEREAKDD
jgi:hypothetical protein